MKSPQSAIGAFDWLLYVVYTATSVAGLTLAKRYLPSLGQAWHDGVLFRKEVLYVGMGSALYVASFLLWLIILSRIDLSVAYPIAIGLTLVVSTLVAAALLGEHITTLRAGGIVIVFAGVWLITRS